jgi:hypothetical protein
MKSLFQFVPVALFFVFGGCLSSIGRAADDPVIFDPDANPLAMPPVGAQWLRVLSPTVLELTLINSKAPDARVNSWDWVDDNNLPRLPAPTAFRVMANGKSIEVLSVGFKRRPLYAPLAKRDLRIGNYLYLKLAASLPDNARVEVTGPELQGQFSSQFKSTRLSPALHVNQVGYLPSSPKMAIVGFYLGSLGELETPTTQFQIIEAGSGKVVFNGNLSPRPDEGYTYAVKPYQQVLQADFSDLKIPGTYRFFVPGLGVSFPFSINDGVAANITRTYALGLYHQRCGMENSLPFTRFTHQACHTAPVDVPTMEFAKMQAKLAGMSENFKSNPRHSAPQLKNTEASLYPFVKQGKIDVSGGHHDAGDYSKYTINSAQLIHHLVFAADVFPGVAALDNLGLPESGDGRSDLLQIAKWEADFLAKMQDEDGGFYFLVYPRERSYENDVLPDKGDPQVVFPKTTSVTAAATATLAQTASSPSFRKQFPQAAALYLEKAKKGWAFLQRALEKHGRDGAYQKITHYGDTFMHDDELAWAATEIYLATGDNAAHEQLLKYFDPSSREATKWGWVRLFDAYGCAIRSYAFAMQSGRVAKDKLNTAHLQKCEEQIVLGGTDQVKWAKANAYGTSFPIESKRFRNAGWYFPLSSAFDIAVLEELKPSPEKKQSILSNLDFESGSNPNNVTFLTGLGWKRQREVVHHYAMNDRRVLPPAGLPLGAIQEGFPYLDKYKKELGTLTFPSDGDKDNAYAFYDRWGDTFNTSTEFVIINQARGLATAAVLMAGTPQAKQAWRSASAKIQLSKAKIKAGEAVTAKLLVENLDIKDAQIVWESNGNEPVFARDYSFTPQAGPQWIEAEAVWPDGRRVFAVTEFTAE